MKSACRKGMCPAFVALTLLFASGCARSHRHVELEERSGDAGVADGGVTPDAFVAAVDAGSPRADDARTVDGPCPDAFEVHSDRDGPGLSGAITNLQDSWLVRFDEGEVKVMRFMSKIRNDAYATWSGANGDAGYFYTLHTGLESVVRTRVALVRAPTRIQDIVDPRALEYAEATEGANLGDVAVFHHEASDSFLALRLEQITELDGRPECVTDGGRNPYFTATFSFYLVDGAAGGFSGFGRP